MSWILNNKEWLFSGVGVSFFSVIFGYIFRRINNKSGIDQVQKSGSNSNNIQVGKNINIDRDNDK